jgi:UDP-N-acetylglucosamine--N-acetylmuramyl-(pentapeptide) pyrophosphoryl-undecaprenol N-acetylglucosamine transferase
MTKNPLNKVIFLIGGGTGGSVSPLLAIYDEFKLNKQAGDDKFNFIWIGSYHGPEREMVEKENIRFIPIYSGRLRRYFSWENITDILRIKLGFFQSIYLIIKLRPNLIISAGSFISVPMVWAAWLCRVPVIIHQQDIRPGLANKLMAPLAKTITVSFGKSLLDYGKKAKYIGNLSRINIINNLDKNIIKQQFGITGDWPIIFITGGGTGAKVLNELVISSLNELTQFANIVHQTGIGKGDLAISKNNYFPFEFLSRDKMSAAYLLSDIVIARSGLATLTELSVLGKPAIIVPMPDSHQEENAEYFKSHKAIIYLDQKTLNKEIFISEIKRVLNDANVKNKLSDNIKKVMKPGARPEMAGLIRQIIK